MPLAFVAVHTDTPAPETFVQMRAWHGLVERIKAVPVPVLLQLASTNPYCLRTHGQPGRSPRA
jgi:hypothetical protein